VSKQRDPRVADHGVSFAEAARFWIRLGFINFGGPTGQIAIMHEELVVRRRWISEARFLHALNYCVLLPGPEAQQLATYVGWLLHRVRGGLVAGIAFILPGFFLILGLSWVYAVHGDVTAIAGLFDGLQAAVVGIIAAAVLRIGRTALRGPVAVAIAAAAFVAIYLAHVPFPFVVVGAAVVGLAAGRRWSAAPSADAETSIDEVATAIGDDGAEAPHTVPSARRAVRVLAIGLAVWIVPLALVALAPGAPAVLGEQATFFSKAAMVTFGGAYAVLAYINQAAVQDYGWILPGQMVTGLGLAESTPGPLIMVTEFVGFLGAFRNPGGLEPVAAGVLGAIVVTWATFAPCFLWIFLGGPYMERLRGNRALQAALGGVTASVVGVVLSLALSFATLTLFTSVRSVQVLGGPLLMPRLGSLDLAATVIAGAAFVALWRLKWSVVPVIMTAAALGVVRALIA